MEQADNGGYLGHFVPVEGRIGRRCLRGLLVPSPFSVELSKLGSAVDPELTPSTFPKVWQGTMDQGDMLRSRRAPV